jgi:hypothetical protein
MQAKGALVPAAAAFGSSAIGFAAVAALARQGERMASWREAAAKSTLKQLRRHLAAIVNASEGRRGACVFLQVQSMRS